MQLCPECHGTGAIDDRYCSCAAAIALRERIQSIPGFKEIQERIDRMLDEASVSPFFVEWDDLMSSGSIQVAKRPWKP
jgi:hypothetical protein